MRTNIVGQEAPRFTLENEHGEPYDSVVFEGIWCIIFFYSRNNSPTCKRGCLTFKEQHDLFASVGQFPSKSSFLVGPDNTIKYVYDWLFRPRRHVAKILADISQVRGDG